MSGIKFDFSELEEFDSEYLSYLIEANPRHGKNFISSCAGRLTTNIRRDEPVGLTGNLKKGYRKGRAYIYNGNEYQARVVAKAPAHHAWLVEHGHNMVTRSGRKVGFVKGNHIVSKNIDSFSKEFKRLADKYVTRMLDKGL